MNETIAGIIRHLLTIGGGFLVAKGTIDSGQAELAAGAFTSIIGIIWSVMAKRKPSV